MRKRLVVCAVLGSLALLVGVGVVRGAPARSSGEPRLRGRAVSEWGRRALHNDKAVRAEALNALLELSWWELADGAVPPLTAALKDGRSEVRERAVLALRLLHKGPAIPPERDRLLRQLEHPHHVNRCQAIDKLRYWGKEVVSASPALARRLRDDVPVVRLKAAVALAELLGPQAEEAIFILIDAFSDPDAYLDRPLAAAALGRIGPKAEAAVPVLAATLRSDWGGLRARAASALGGIGPGARPALPALRKLLRDPDIEVRTAAALALWQLGGEAKESLPGLIAVLQITDESQLSNIAGSERLRPALRALGEMGPKAKAAVPTLRRLLKYEQQGLRWWAGQALKQVDPRAAVEAGVP
jgi:HEAT repeats/PBS lyase HEAT-like repeat